MHDIASRIERLESINAIRKVVHQMTILQDRPYDLATVEYYSTDAVLESGSFGSFRGREAIRDLYRYLPESVSFTLHYKFGGLIELDEGNRQATGTWVSIEAPVVRGDALIGAVRQQSRYKVEDGEWKVARYEQQILCMAVYDEGWSRGESKASAWDPAVQDS